MNCLLLRLELLTDSPCKFCKTCISAKYCVIHLGLSMCCEAAKYTMWHTQNTHPWLAKMWCCQKSNFCSGEWVCYAKHLLQWRRVFLCVVLVWQDKCVVRWWCGTAIWARYFAITMSTQFLLYILYVWLSCLVSWISWSLSVTCANEE